MEVTRVRACMHACIMRNTDEHDAARFLKARNYDLAAARAMWEAMLAWRRELRVDTIHEWFSFNERDAYNKIYPTGLHQVDREVRRAGAPCGSRAPRWHRHAEASLAKHTTY